jgi:type IX secretion system PorP/SprF family membrane protein
MMKKLTLPLVVLALVTIRSQAQQDPQFSQYMFNTIYYNPAFAGVDGVTRMTGTFRSQWTGYQPTTYGGGAPTTELLTFNTPTAKGNGGMGFTIANDHLGPQNNLQGMFSYAYHLGFRDSKLSFGISAGGFSQSINYGLYRATDPDDPLLKNSTGTTSQVRKDLAAGVYYRKEKYYAGLSFDHLLKSTFDFGGNARSTLQPHVYFTAGYYYEVNFDLKFQFSTLVQSDFTKTTTSVTALAYLKDTMWGGLSFRQSDAVILILGYSILKDKSLKVGYSLDYIVSNQAAKQPTSNEIILTYELPTNPGPSKKIVRTPRYRH